MAYSLGLKSSEDLQEMIRMVMQGQSVETDSEPGRWTYEELMALKFKLVDVSDLYRYNEEYAVWEDMSTDSEYMAQLIREPFRFRSRSALLSGLPA